MVWAILIYVFATGQQFQVPVGNEVQCKTILMEMDKAMWDEGVRVNAAYHSTCKRVPRRMKV